MSTQGSTFSSRMTVPKFGKLKGERKITMLTAYDANAARLIDQAGIDSILVGDSVGTVVYGEEDTLSVTMEQMLAHTRAVTRVATQALVIGDMPFMSYQVSVAEAVRNAGRFLKEARAHAVKLEGGKEMAETVEAIVRAGIPVVGHIGLTPQKIHAMGGYRMHGKDLAERALLLESALALEAAGAFAIVLECVEAKLSEEITQRLRIPTIGIGAGSATDGQVLVTADLVGLTTGHVPRFVEPVANLKEDYLRAVLKFRDRVTKTKPEKRESGKVEVT